jgi:hypothetical protein
MVSITCPRCHDRLEARPGATGSKVRCDKCGCEFALNGASPDRVAPPFATPSAAGAPRKNHLALLIVIAAGGAFLAVMMIAVVGFIAWQASRPEPLHKLKERLAAASQHLEVGRERKAFITDPKTIARLQASGETFRPWSAEEERNLRDAEAEVKRLQDELTDRGQ